MSKLCWAFFPWLPAFLLFPLSLAQIQPATSAKPDYSQEAFIYQQHSLEATFENDGTSSTHLAAQIKIQSEAGVQQFGLLRFSYQSAVESIQIQYVRVRKLDGTLVETPPENIQDMPAEITREAPFYSDLREKHIAVKGLSTGDVLEYAYGSQVQKPLVPGQFWFEYGFTTTNIVLQEKLEVRVPRDRPIKIKSLTVQPAISDDGKYRLYTWTTSNLKAKPEEDEQKQALEQTEGRFPPPDVRISSFQSWQEIGNWYNDLQRERISSTPEIAAKAAELTKNATDDEARLHAIYNYVSTQFRYIGIAFGIGRYQPHSATDVLNNQYGDCKDKHTLLAALLTAAGFRVSPALISSIREVDADVPSPAQFNHVISVVSKGNQLTWLDSTAEVGPFGYLIPQLLNKHALVIGADKPAQLVTTPPQLPFKTWLRFKCEGKLSSEGTLEAKIERTDRGDTELLLRAALRRLPQTQWKDLVQKLSYASGFAGEVSNVVASSPDALDQPLHISYSYTRKNYGDWDNRRIGPPLPFLLFSPPKDDKKPTVPFYFGSPGEMILESRVELPKGYTLQPLPAVNLKYDFGEYHASYEVDKGVLVAKRQMTTYRTEIPLAAMGDFNAFRKAVNNDYESMASLASPTETAQSNGSARPPLQQALFDLPGSANPEAARLEEEGRRQLQSGDVFRGIDALSQAVQADPKFTRAWIALGAAYMMSRRKDAAIDAFQAAVKADPKQPVAYKTLAFAFMQMQQREKALSVLQDLARTFPSDSDGHANLASVLYALKRYQEAASEYQSALQLGKDSAEIESGLGLSYLQAGDHERGAAAIEKAVRLDSSANTLNNIGYELAEADQELPTAQEYAEKAVRAVEEESRLVTLNNLTMEDLARMSSLSAYWDTLGWVYFRCKRFDDAQKYLAAAWNLSQDPVVGDHLGQLYQAQGHKSAAIRSYQLALAAGSVGIGANDMPETRKRLAKLGGSATRAPFNAGEDLSKMRSTHVRRIVPGSASAEFFLLISAGPSVEDAKFVSGNEKLKSAAAVLKASKLNVSFPDHGPTLLLRRGLLVCSAVTGCEFVLFAPSDVHSLN